MKFAREVSESTCYLRPMSNGERSEIAVHPTSATALSKRGSFAALKLL